MKKFLKKVWDAIGVWIMLSPFILVPVALIIWGIVGTVQDLNKPRVEDVDDSYYEGYSEGYDEGFEVGSDIGYDEGFEVGSDIGYYEGYCEAEEEYSYYGWLEDEAIHYARQHSEWSPEEAWMLIEAYQDNEPFYADGSSPSEQDFLNAIDSLIYFYDYFYSARYK